MSCKQKNGFTLIELSIVLVIIGMIVGGVLVGRDLIEAGNIRKEISTFQQYMTAANTFKTKYACLPGDCGSATQFFTGVINGNNNGLVDGSVWPSTESFQFWVHLLKAGLVTGNYQGADWSDAPPGTLNPDARYITIYWPATWYANNSGTPGI